MRFLVAIGWFFAYWSILFLGIIGMLLLAMWTIDKTSKKPKQSVNEYRDDRKAAYQIILTVLFATMIVAWLAS